MSLIAGSRSATLVVLGSERARENVSAYLATKTCSFGKTAAKLKA